MTEETLKSIKELLLREDLTDLEKKVVEVAGEYLWTWIGIEDYSCMTFHELWVWCNSKHPDRGYEGVEISYNELKGVIGSLVKKEIFFTYDRNEGENPLFYPPRHEVVFVNQAEMER